MIKLTTSGGYEYLETISALQKSIRRGMEADAMYWALELFPQYEKALWIRLRVIVNEDIGLASPETIMLVDSLANHFWALEKESSKRLVLGNAILAMCRAKKTRLADHFQCAITQHRTQNGFHLEIPDVALDKHTRRGRSMGRDWEHFFNEGTKLQNQDKRISDPYEETAKSLWPTLIQPQDIRNGNKGKKGKGRASQVAEKLGLFEEEAP